jgi:hypothetical protein
MLIHLIPQNVLKSSATDSAMMESPYEFFLQKFRLVQCVRLLTCEWEGTQKWISLNVPFVEEYHKTKFTFTVEKTSPVALVLSQVSWKPIPVWLD